MYDKPIEDVKAIADTILSARKKYHNGKLNYFGMSEICGPAGTDPDVIIYFLTTPLNLTHDEVETVTLILPNKWGSDNEWENPTYKEAITRLKDDLDLVLPNHLYDVKFRLKNWCGIT